MDAAFDPHLTVIERYSHHFVVKRPSNAIIKILYRIAGEYTEHEMVFDPVKRRKVWRPTKTYAIYVNRGREFRFHKNQWLDLERALQRERIDRSSYTVVDMPTPEGEPVDIALRSEWILRPEQEEAVDFIVQNGSSDLNSPLLLAAMGRGKTLMSMAAVAKLGQRFAIVVLGGYTDKWVGDITKNLDLDKKQIAVIQGSDALQRCSHYPGSEIPTPPAFVISISTIQKWHKLYEQDPNHPKLDAYGCKPYEFFQHLKIGTVVYDEAHQHPYGVYRCFAYMHVKKAIALTATMKAKNPILQKVQSIMFPLQARYDAIKMGKYITSWQCAYQIPNFESSRLRTTEWGSNTYSHTAFEKSILHNKRFRSQYLSMLMDLIQTTYVEDYIQGDKLLVFVATANMAEVVMHAIKQRWPKYDTRTYLEKDPYENVIDPDIRVSTVIGAGTAIDIPNLRRAILTIAVDSPNANLQALGRLRELKDRDVHYYWLTCSSIPKHQEYANSKVELFEEWTKEQKKRFLGTLYP